jgi:hypothetical protein
MPVTNMCYQQRASARYLSWLIYNTWSIIGAFPVTKGDLCPLPKWVFHVVIMSREWLEEVESFAEVIRLPTRLRTINCMVIGMDGSFGYDPGLGINIISSSLVQTQLSEEPIIFISEMTSCHPYTIFRLPWDSKSRSRPYSIPRFSRFWPPRGPFT